jgi:hypothetical protein
MKICGPFGAISSLLITNVNKDEGQIFYKYKGLEMLHLQYKHFSRLKNSNKESDDATNSNASS